MLGFTLFTRRPGFNVIRPHLHSITSTYQLPRCGIWHST